MKVHIFLNRNKKHVWIFLRKISYVEVEVPTQVPLILASSWMGMVVIKNDATIGVWSWKQGWKPSKK